MKENLLQIIQEIHHSSLFQVMIMGEELTMTDDLLSKCVIDTSKRTVYLYSDGGDKKTVACDTVDEFMNVLNFVRDKVEEERVFYSDPL